MPLKQQILVLEEKQITCNKIIDDLKEELKTVNEEITITNASKLDLENLVEKYRSEIEQIKMDNKSEINEKNEEIKNIKIQFESEKSELLEHAKYNENTKEIEKLLEDNKQLLSLLNTERNDIEIVRGELNIKSDELSQLSNQIELSNQKCKSLEDDLNQKNIDFERFKNEQNQSETVNSLNEKILLLENEIKSIQIELQNKTRECENIIENNRDLTFVKEKLIKDKENFTHLLATKYTEIENLIESFTNTTEFEDKYNNLFQNHNELLKLVEHLKLENDSLKLNLENLNRKGEEELLKIKKEFENSLMLTERSSALHDQSIVMRDEKIQSLEMNMNEIIKALADQDTEAKVKLDELQHEIEIKDRKIREITEDNKSLSNSLEESISNIKINYVALLDYNDIKTNFEKLEYDYKQIIQQNADLEKELNIFRTQYEEATANNSNSISIDAHNTEIIDLKVHLNEYRSSLEEKIDEIKDLQNSIDNFRILNQEKDQELDNIKSTLIEKENVQRDLEEKLNSLEVKTKDETDLMSSNMSEKTALLNENQIHIETQQKHIQTLENEISNTKKQIQLITNKFSEEKEILEKSLKDNENNIKTLNSNLKAKDDELIAQLIIKDNEIQSLQSALTLVKNENQDLLSEMKEINQVFKERGGIISKQQSTVVELENKVVNLQELVDKNKNIIDELDNIKNELNKYKRMCEERDRTIKDFNDEARDRGCVSGVNGE